MLKLKIKTTQSKNTNPENILNAEIWLDAKMQQNKLRCRVIVCS